LIYKELYNLDDIHHKEAAMIESTNKSFNQKKLLDLKKIIQEGKHPSQLKDLDYLEIVLNKLIEQEFLTASDQKKQH